jgi:predicted nucleotidyltransferase
VKTIDQSLLDEVANRPAQEFHPEGIWLFGSHARGTPDEGSDLDLFVVVSESDEPPVERMRRAHRCLRGLGIAKDVLVKTRAEFDRSRALPSTLDHLVFHRGRKLYETRGQPSTGGTRGTMLRRQAKPCEFSSHRTSSKGP